MPHHITVAGWRHGWRVLALMATAGGSPGWAQTAGASPPVITMSAVKSPVSPESAPVMPHTAAKGAPTPPVPTGRPGDWISDNDYPRTPLANHVSGIVGFELSVAANGIPSGCEITKSSKDADLDAVTCQLISRRAHFIPAKDADGKPVAGVYRSSVRWQLPDIALPVTGEFSIAFDVNADGSMTNCTAKASGDVLARMPGGNPQTMCRQAHYVVPVDAAGKPVKRHYVFETKVSATEAP